MNRFDDKTDETASIWSLESLITKTEPWLETFLTVHQEASWVYGHFGQVAEGAGEDHAMLEADRRYTLDIFRPQLDEDDDDDDDDDDVGGGGDDAVAADDDDYVAAAADDDDYYYYYYYYYY